MLSTNAARRRKRHWSSLTAGTTGATGLCLKPVSHCLLRRSRSMVSTNAAFIGGRYYEYCNLVHAFGFT